MAFLYFVLVFVLTWLAGELLNPLWAMVVFIISMVSFMLYAVSKDENEQS
jgi:hypothetical protein